MHSLSRTFGLKGGHKRMVAAASVEHQPVKGTIRPRQRNPIQNRTLRSVAGALALVAGAASSNAEDVPRPIQEYVCRQTSGEIELDGRLSDKAWAEAPAIESFAPHWDRRKSGSHTTARLLWDAHNLYFAAEMTDTDLYADIREPDGMTWYNDVFELFFKPAVDRPAYYEFQVTPANTQMDMLLPSRGAGGYLRFAREGEFDWETGVSLSGTLNHWQDGDTSWEVEGRIPWSDFRLTGGSPAAGERWKFNLCRYDYSVEFERAELSCCSGLTVGDFHRYEDFAWLRFE